MSREAEGPGLRPPGPSGDIGGGNRRDIVVCSVTDEPDIARVLELGRFGQPSNYSLDQVTLARHVRGLRRDGWQSWEIRARFDFGAAA